MEINAQFLGMASLCHRGPSRDCVRVRMRQRVEGEQKSTVDFADLCSNLISFQDASTQACRLSNARNSGLGAD
jgi:hypothetical protein